MFDKFFKAGQDKRRTLDLQLNLFLIINLLTFLLKKHIHSLMNEDLTEDTKALIYNEKY